MMMMKKIGLEGVHLIPVVEDEDRQWAVMNMLEPLGGIP
jgi:hypothetical protein